MSTAVQAAVLLGVLLGGGVWLLLIAVLPAPPDLGDAISRLQGTPGRRSEDTAVEVSRTIAIGRRAMPVLGRAPFIRIPTSDLAIIRMPAAEFLGLKVFGGLVGLLMVPALSLFLAVLGLALQWVIPAALSLILAAVLFLLPDINVRTRAAAARLEFSRALSAYIDLVALARRAGRGATQSLSRAAGVGDSWVFVRLTDELSRAELSGRAPWDALARLSHELDLPALDDLADIMRLTGSQGASVYESLRARSSSLRNQILSDEQADAGSATERMRAPIAMLALIAVVFIVTPAMSSLLA